MISSVSEGVLRTPSPRRLVQATEIGLALLLGLQVARLVWVIASPPGPIGAPAPPPAATAMDLSVLARFDPFYRDGTPSATAASDAPDAPQAQLPAYRLHGVRVEGGGGGSAILAAPDGRQLSVAVGEELEGGVTLAAVANDHVVLAHAGGRETLAFAPGQAGAGSAPAPAPRRTAAPPAGASAVVDRQGLVSQMGLRPRLDGERVSGFEVLPRGGGALVRQAGLQPGDVILTVNGQDVTPENLAEQTAELRNATEAVIRFERGGRVMSTTLRMPGA